MICTLMLGFRGLVALARRSGEIVSITAEIVFQKDKFEAIEGTGGHLVHQPDWFAEDRGVPRGAYAFAKLKGGGEQWIVMGRRAIESIRAKSKAVNSGPWKRDKERPNEISFEELEMWKKTAVRRIFKLLPVTIETAQAIDEDDDREFGERDVSPRASSSRPALPSSESSGAMRVDDVMPPTQAETLKSEIRQTASSQPAQAQRQAQPTNDDGEPLGADGRPEQADPAVVRAAEGGEPAKAEEKKPRAAAAKASSSASAPPPGESAPPPSVASSKPAEPAQPAEKKVAAPGAGLAIASGIIDRAEAAGEIGLLVELDGELTAAVEAGKVGSTHVARAKKAIESARSRVLASNDGGDQ